MASPLKLRAEDDEDIAVISTVLQDAYVAVGEMVYQPEEQRFVLVANRFRWEPESASPRPQFERTLSGLRIDTVKSVQRRGFSPRETERLLVLLALRADGNAIYLDFAGGSSIRLEIDRVLCHLDDLGEPWPTSWRPRHPVAENEPR
jgi:hypothetical protein